MSLIVAAGGTGGHLFPARALAEEMTRRGYRVDLVTEQRGERYGKGFPACQVHYVPSATLASHSPLAIAKTLCTLVQGTAVAWALMRRTRPAAIVGLWGLSHIATAYCRQARRCAGRDPRAKRCHGTR